jgi:EF-hand domain
MYRVLIAVELLDITVCDLRCGLPTLTSLSNVEFASLFKYIGDWRTVFHRFDRDRSGSIEGRELAEALRSFGFNLSPAILRVVEQKYGEMDMRPPRRLIESMNM